MHRNAKKNAGEADESGARDRNVGTITLYSNGFRIGDGEFKGAFTSRVPRVLLFRASLLLVPLGRCVI
jgi:hypothetical protein